MRAAALGEAGSWCCCNPVVSRCCERGRGRTNLDQSCDFLVLRDDRIARDTRESNLAGVAFERSIDEGGSHSVDVSLGFRIGERLIGSRLLKAERDESAGCHSVQDSQTHQATSLMFPAPPAAAAAPSKPKTGSLIRSGLFCCKDARTVMRNCSWECSCEGNKSSARVER